MLAGLQELVASLAIAVSNAIDSVERPVRSAFAQPPAGPEQTLDANAAQLFAREVPLSRYAHFQPKVYAAATSLFPLISR